MEVVVSPEQESQKNTEVCSRSSAKPPAQADAPQGIEELSQQLLSWIHLWPGNANESTSDAGHSIVRERLGAWLERCFGSRAEDLLSNRTGDVSLATSTPLFTAFLGRRATRELSRQVLKGL
jgi:hypothetical protein